MPSLETVLLLPITYTLCIVYSMFKYRWHVYAYVCVYICICLHVCFTFFLVHVCVCLHVLLYITVYMEQTLGICLAPTSHRRFGYFVPSSSPPFPIIFPTFPHHLPHPSPSSAPTFLILCIRRICPANLVMLSRTRSRTNEGSQTDKQTKRWTGTYGQIDTSGLRRPRI